MARRPRSERIIPYQPNHIVCRGNNRRRLFSYASDYLRYLRLLEEALRAHGCRLHAFCLMGNHVHLLITPPSVEATSKVMHSVNQRYAQLRNGKRGGSGKLFEQRFESEPSKTEDHVRNSVLYIDANPFAAHMRQRRDYRWSTMNFHLGKTDSKLGLQGFVEPTPWYLSLGSSEEERALAYLDEFNRYLDGNRKKEFFDRAMRMEPVCGGHARLERPDRSRASEQCARLFRKEECSSPPRP